MGHERGGIFSADRLSEKRNPNDGVGGFLHKQSGKVNKEPPARFAREKMLRAILGWR
jgi:hypothetical protein